MSEELKTLVETFCANVQSTERMVRQRALKDFLDFTRGDKLSSMEAPEVFDGTYLHVLRCYADRFEMIRSLAISVVNEMLAKLPANDYYLGYIIPVITKRIGQREIIEDSEEVRLLLLEQLELIIEKYSDPDGSRGDPLLKSYDGLIDILIKTLKDPFPAAQKQSCEIVKQLASATPSMHYRAEALVSPTVTVLKHRHSANRIAAIEALGVVSLHIRSNSDSVLKIIVDISPLLMDSVPFVRRACGRVGCLMLMELRDRYSYFHRIMPLVLNCLTDDTAEVRDDILERWKKAGELYYVENEAELSKAKLADLVPPNYPGEYERPTLPCRAIVQRSLKIVELILHEMEEWKEDIRLHATKLLKLVVLHAEKSLSTLFMQINPVLAKTCMDSDKDISSEALKVAHLCGILLEYETWSKHALVEFRKFHSFGHLKCINAMYNSSGIEKLKHLKKITSFLTDSEVCHNLKEPYQLELLSFCERLIPDYHRVFHAKEIEGLANESDQLAVERMLYTVVLKVAAFSYEDALAVRDRALQVLALLDSRLDALHERHMASVIISLENLETINSDSSDSIRLLAGIVSVCGFRLPYHTVLKKSLEIALKHASPPGKIKLFSSISIALLQWKDTMQASDEKHSELVKNFIEETIAPYLVWAAGRSSESIRSMATACLCAMSQGVENSIFAPIVVGQLKTLGSLSEDNSIAARAYSLRTLLAIGPLPFDDLRPIAFAILARLDDPSSEVRELGATCLGRLQLQLPVGKGESTDEAARWEETLRQIVPIMFLHLENPELKIRKAVLESLGQLAVHHRPLIKGLANEVATGCPYKEDLDNLFIPAAEPEAVVVPAEPLIQA
ncbi:dynein axonemal assembly factor 5 [Uranotaenia lowii]|uniref:dynein axonemal assembly factor 5 n=1 Tax=Uranotaenia lowii TaxID=190385 RepID=UPI00247A2765|nr:dynein axonemal assembly factor 5 [Uranotaenia lowii]